MEEFIEYPTLNTQHSTSNEMGTEINNNQPSNSPILDAKFETAFSLSSKNLQKIFNLIIHNVSIYYTEV